MRPVSSAFPINQPFGSMKTAGVVGDISKPDTVEYYVARYGNYQPYGHAGCDFECPEGTPVYAAAAGTVLWADWGTNLPGDDSDWGYRQRWYLYKGFPGIVTVIQHDGWIGVYAHLSAAPLNIGDRVREGQRIGLSGGTGGVAPHLHVEALVDLSFTTGGGLVYGRTDPTPYFGSGGAAIGAQSESIKPIPKEPFTMGQYEDINKKLDAIAKTAQNTWAGVWTGGTNDDGFSSRYGLLPIAVESQRRDSVNAAKTQAQIAGLVGAIAAMSKGEPFDQAKLLAGVQAAAEAGVKAGIQDGTVTVDVNVAGKQ